MGKKKNALKAAVDVTKSKEDTDLVADGLRWKKVQKPRVWHPERAGDVLVGRYMGRQQREGVHGHYTQVVISTHAALPELVYATGAVLMALFDGVPTPLIVGDTMVRIVFKGWKESTTSDHKYKDFDLFIEA